MKRLFLFFAWLPAALATLFFSLKTFSHISKIKDIQYLITAESRYLASSSKSFLAYAAIPRTTQDFKTAIKTGDARPVIIDLYFSRFNSPMQGYGKFIIEMAEKYNVDPYLFIAIAQQESNLGKKMPSEDCHNAWGYGIHSRGTLCFASWEEGIETVMKGLKNRFIDKGYAEPQDIMKLYTPLSQGSWADGVQQFISDMKSGNF